MAHTNKGFCPACGTPTCMLYPIDDLSPKSTNPYSTFNNFNKKREHSDLLSNLPKLETPLIKLITTNNLLNINKTEKCTCKYIGSYKDSFDCPIH